MSGLSSPTSPIPTLATMNPWSPLLKKGYNKNFLYTDEPIFISMSNIKRSGDVSMHCLQFQSFVQDDERFLIFNIALNDTLMGDIKSDPNARLCWTMPKSKEYFKLSGKFYIASSPLQVTRFPPPRVAHSEAYPSAAAYWEDERRRQWRSLSDKVRATYTFPARGEPRADRASFACQSLGHLDNDQQKKGISVNDKLKIVHDIAMDNFCLLVFKVIEVEHFDYHAIPSMRTLYTFSSKESTWLTEALNP